MTEWYSAADAAKLPGLPTTKVCVIDKANRNGWQERKRAGKGGGKEYHWRSFPTATQKYLIEQHAAKNAPAICPLPSDHPVIKATQNLPVVAAPAEKQTFGDLTKRQKQVVEARLWFMTQIQNRPHGERVQQCIDALVQKAADGVDPYRSLALAANARPGKARIISSSTLMKMWSLWLKTKDPVELAPHDNDAKCAVRELAIREWAKNYKPGTRTALPPEVPDWMPWFLDAYRKTGKPSIRDARRELRDGMPEDIPLPSYDQLTSMCEKLPATILEKGRMTGAEYKALQGFARRDWSDYEPGDVGQIDGHSFKAYVAHPTTGAHFHPEVCGLICLHSKVLFGWSWGVAESAQTVADAYRHACTKTEDKPYAVIFKEVEADRGPGNMANVNLHPLTGRFSRVGTTLVIEEKGGNPQGHGGVERSNQSIWIRAARSLPTYTGKDADKVTKKKVYVRLEKDLKAVEKAGQLGMVEKTSKLLLSAEQFTEFLKDWAYEYNFMTSHSALPKITAPEPGVENGKPVRRHMTPMEYLATRIQAGWRPVMADQELLPHLFKPHEEINIFREEFTLRGNRYHSYELRHYHGKTLVGAYDIHDPKLVDVIDQEDRLICQAVWNGNKKAGRPVSAQEQAAEHRAKQQIKNLQKKIDLRTAETKPALAIESPPALAAARTLLLAEQPKVAMPESPKARYRQYKQWCAVVESGGSLPQDILDKMKVYETSAEYQNTRVCLENPEFCEVKK